MTHLEDEMRQLKEAVLDMAKLVQKQLKKSRDAFLDSDLELAEEVMHAEPRVNAFELSINRDCENILALFSPVATDLRFVLAMLNVVSELERLGDYAKGIAKYVEELNSPIDQEMSSKIELVQLFDTSINMLEDIYKSLEDEDSSIARKVFKQDKIINKISAKAPQLIEQLIIDNPSRTRSALYLFSTIRRLERVGDRAKNLAEDIIFYLDAEILKHAKKK